MHNAAMANPEHVAIINSGVDEWNRWRREAKDVWPELSKAPLSRANLPGANLNAARLSYADLSSADLSGADLTFADLDGANLENAILVRTNLTIADLSGARLTNAILTNANLSSARLGKADLSYADLRKANFSGTYLRAACFKGSIFDDTLFENSDLTLAKELDTVVHQGPSKMDKDTVSRSGGSIPDVFLRAFGFSDSFISYVKSVAGDAMERCSCFISYSTKDQEFAERLYADLQASNVRCWFAPHDIQGGKKIHEQIDEAIRLHDKLLLILSSDSIESAWVETEISKARKRELRDERRVLFPVRLVDFETLKKWECFDPDTGKDSAREIREYFIPDFSDWKNHDSYQKALQRLLKDLKSV